MSELFFGFFGIFLFSFSIISIITSIVATLHFSQKKFPNYEAKKYWRKKIYGYSFLGKYKYFIRVIINNDITFPDHRRTPFNRRWYLNKNPCYSLRMMLWRIVWCLAFQESPNVNSYLIYPIILPLNNVQTSCSAFA